MSEYPNELYDYESEPLDICNLLGTEEDCSICIFYDGDFCQHPNKDKQEG